MQAEGPTAQVVEGWPDLVIEILSRSNTRRELEGEVQGYQTIGVCEAWVISPQGQTVEVLQLSATAIQRSGLYGRSDAIASQVLPDLHLTVDDIFPQV